MAPDTVSHAQSVPGAPTLMELLGTLGPPSRAPVGSEHARGRGHGGPAPDIRAACRQQDVRTAGLTWWRETRSAAAHAQPPSAAVASQGRAIVPERGPLTQLWAGPASPVGAQQPGGCVPAPRDGLWGAWGRSTSRPPPLPLLTQSPPHTLTQHACHHRRCLWGDVSDSEAASHVRGHEAEAVRRGRGALSTGVRRTEPLSSGHLWLRKGWNP